jgi:hypothetical protein
MSRRLMSVCILALAGTAGLLSTTQAGRTGQPVFPLAVQLPRLRHKHAAQLAEARPDKTLAHAALSVNAASGGRCLRQRGCISPLSIPMTFEPNIGQLDPRAEFVGRGAGMTVLLTRSGLDVEVADRAPKPDQPRIRVLRLRFGWTGTRKAPSKTGRDRGQATPAVRDENLKFAWRGEERVRTVSNYFIGGNPRQWRTDVPHFARAVARSRVRQRLGAVVYGNQHGLEYDLRLPPGDDSSALRLRFSGARQMQLAGGDLILSVGERKVRMKKPTVYEELPGGTRRGVRAEYRIEADGSVGFYTAAHDPRATLVVDPSISVAYATFLGGVGNETAGNVAVDQAGKVYVAGVTASSSTFPEATASRVGPVVGASAFYIAKIDPTVTGANSLVYLTFLGGSGKQSGGVIAVDGAGDVAITGTTTSADFPVTGSSQPTSGLTSGDGNDAIVSEINTTGNQLNFSAYFGGSGEESSAGPGGIAVDHVGNVYIASDTEPSAVDPSSPDLPVTAGAYQPDWDGENSDGFLAIFAPPSQTGGTPIVTYCTYLGTNSVGTVGVGGVAVDSNGNAYVAGSTSNAANGFPVQDAFQSQYGGGSSDGFVMKIAPLGQGTGDLVYATLIGGGGMDEISGIAVDSSLAPKAYVTGETQSPDFPVNGTNAPYQGTLRANPHTSDSANAFLAVIAQNPASGTTSLDYSTYLGGSLTDSALSVAVVGPSGVYIAGQTDSPDFPWHNNLQPFNGGSDAFLAKFDTTASGASSLVYATPLGGTSPVGETVDAAATGVAANTSGQVYVTGETTAADFPTAITTAGPPNGFQPNCDSCQAASPSGDAFLLAISESGSSGPSVYFSSGSQKFSVTSIGNSVVGQPIAVLNGGEQNLTISDIEVVGPNASDFSPQFGPCIGTPISPGSSAQCSLEVTFTPSVGGPETAFVSVWDNAPGSPQLFEMTGTGGAPHALITPSSLNFGTQPINAVKNDIQTITVTNSGTQGLLLAQENGPATSSFSIVGSTCSFSGVALAAGNSCKIDVTFAPTSAGTVQDQIAIQDNSDMQPAAVQTVALTGTGTPPSPIVQIQPTTGLNFGTVVVGSKSGPQTITLSNEGSAALDVTGITIAGTDAADFAIDANVTTCPVGGGTVAIGAQCTVGVQLAPQSAGSSKTASLVFSDNAGNSPQSVALTGAATNPAVLKVSPATLTFAAEGEGTASAAQTITITNTGSSAASLGALSLTGSNASDFSEQSACSPVLSAGTDCQVSISFEPATGLPPGPRMATLDVPGATPASAALSGTATQAAISFTASVNFATQLVGTQGAPQPITITNSSSGPYAGALTFAGIAVAGTNNSDFSITANTCAGPSAAVSPGNSCTVQVAFAPHEPASCGDDPNRTATLNLQDNAPGSPQTIPLTGAAMDFCLASSNGQPVSAPIQAGQTASFNLEIASSGGFAGAVNLSCSVPAGDNLGPCSVSPGSVQASPSGPADFTVSVPTLAPASVLPASGPAHGGGDGSFAVALCGWLVCFGLLGIASAKASGTSAGDSKDRLLRAIQLAALVLALSMGVAACGSGGGSDPPPNPGTPPGTYTVTVAATTAGTSPTTRTASLTLTVD